MSTGSGDVAQVQDTESVRCPGCGSASALPTAWSVVDHCPACGVPLMVTSRTLGVELAVRQRLYGGPRKDAHRVTRTDDGNE